MASPTAGKANGSASQEKSVMASRSPGGSTCSDPSNTPMFATAEKTNARIVQRAVTSLARSSSRTSAAARNEIPCAIRPPWRTIQASVTPADQNGGRSTTTVRLAPCVAATVRATGPLIPAQYASRQRRRRSSGPALRRSDRSMLRPEARLRASVTFCPGCRPERAAGLSAATSSMRAVHVCSTSGGRATTIIRSSAPMRSEASASPAP